ncbi:hypothetical protein Sru01_33200 [Sphaerisporangium rufum]|uniref:Uncharacterized protein n=1 Tax=Sphaerisporangium rufum TaxID=1381558 RepID=A0A919R3F2_9ACTN|nr:hypothetical protein Sru01_33200 [Sphaerisporangium rufum]
MGPPDPFSGGPFVVPDNRPWPDGGADPTFPVAGPPPVMTEPVVPEPDRPEPDVPPHPTPTVPESPDPTTPDIPEIPPVGPVQPTPVPTPPVDPYPDPTVPSPDPSGGLPTVPSPDPSGGLPTIPSPGPSGPATPIPDPSGQLPTTPPGSAVPAPGMGLPASPAVPAPSFPPAPGPATPSPALPSLPSVSPSNSGAGSPTYSGGDAGQRGGTIAQPPAAPPSQPRKTREVKHDAVLKLGNDIEIGPGTRAERLKQMPGENRLEWGVCGIVGLGIPGANNQVCTSSASYLAALRDRCSALSGLVRTAGEKWKLTEGDMVEQANGIGARVPR